MLLILLPLLSVMIVAGAALAYRLSQELLDSGREVELHSEDPPKTAASGSEAGQVGGSAGGGAEESADGSEAGQVGESAGGGAEESEAGSAKVIEGETVSDVAAKRVSATEILIMWNALEGEGEGRYLVMRRGISVGASSGQWEEAGAVRFGQATCAEAKAMGYGYGFSDILASPEPVQHEYRIDREAVDGTRYIGKAGSVAVASNVLVCIDPGHYKKAPESSGGKMYGYGEGIFTLQIGLALREELAKRGIDSRLTRETDDIEIEGFMNSTLDRGHISLRGECAQGSSLFLSLHTNANKDDANGCDTWQQPLALNKTLVIVNKMARDSEWALGIANGIGEAVTAASYGRGLSVTGRFERADMESVRLWTDAFNDSINVDGAVCYRWDGDVDYYGVLRGAANVGVPGMIVEHGYHTVEEMRRQAMMEDLAAEWAKADADGIAKGLGFR